MELMVSKPFLVIFRTALFSIQGCLEFIRTLIYLHLVMIWRIAFLPLALLSLPLRAIAALYHQNKMEIRLQRMNKGLENALWERKDLKSRLDAAIRDRRMIQALLLELEAEHDDAILQIQLLDTQVKELKDQIQRFKKVWGGNNDPIETHNDFRPPESYKSPSNKLRKVEKMFEDDMANNAHFGDEGVLAKHRAVAMSQSLFSATLSLVVAMVVWEAKDPCIPLVMALAAVVTMSLTSVVRFFSTLGHKPYARDAVVLMCFNWFLFGALAYPTLPKVILMLKNVIRVAF